MCPFGTVQKIVSIGTADQGYGYFQSLVNASKMDVSLLFEIGQSSSVFMVRDIAEDEPVPFLYIDVVLS
jgi:hypothetical protein